MKTFDDAFAEVVSVEGGYSSDKNDPGNWTGGKVGVGLLRGTKYGISAASFPAIDIKNLTLAKAKAIYCTNYWLKLSCDKMPIVIGYQVFDMGVNHGVNMAARTLQKAVGVVVDGNIGPITLAAINKLDPNRLAMLLCAARLSYYTALSTWASFGKGWTNRIAHILGVVSK